MSTSVTLGVIPRWLSKHINNHPLMHGVTGVEKAIHGLLHTATNKAVEAQNYTAVAGQTGWLDHWGTTTIDDAKCFVSEPYPGSGDLGLDAFCIQFNLKCEKQPVSKHNTGKCIRILFRPFNGAGGTL
jgi:hypothetical protein